MNEFKAGLRKEYKIIRANVQNKDEKSLFIALKLFETEAFKSAKSVLLYAASDFEVSTKLIAQEAFSSGKDTAFPKCVDKNGRMEFYFSDYNSLAEGMYGIKEPLSNPENKVIDFAETVCIVPGLAFSKDGYRLGYGKGYYDRFLSEFKGISIGICYDECLCDILPKDTYDMQVDCLITDKKIYMIK